VIIDLLRLQAAAVVIVGAGSASSIVLYLADCLCIRACGDYAGSTSKSLSLCSDTHF
jgi:hypothetical protein